MTAASDLKKRSGIAGRPACPQPGPYAEPVEEGRRYRWCSCGLSATQPWCDESHVGTAFQPIEFEAPISGIFYMCGCKRSENAPYCFGNCRGHSRQENHGGSRT